VRRNDPEAYVIGPASPGDAAALAALRLAFRRDLAPLAEPEHDFISRCESWMRERLGVPARFRAWLARADGEPCGSVWLQIIEKLPNPVAEPEWHAYVSSLFVEPRARGAGIGTALLRAALEESERRGVDAVLLRPTPESRTLYQRHGFSVRDDVMERRGVQS
jgi:ribosomal protein S18 acetylase RimI-like enzyme